jgi:hypothetical protein
MRTFSLCLTLVLTVALLQPSSTASAEPNSKPAPHSKEQLKKRAETIVIPQVQFNGAGMAEILEFLNTASKEADPDKIGIPIELHPSALPILAKKKGGVTLFLKDTPTLEVVMYISTLTGLQFRITETKVILMAPNPPQ